MTPTLISCPSSPMRLDEFMVHRHRRREGERERGREGEGEEERKEGEERREGGRGESEPFLCSVTMDLRVMNTHGMKPPNVDVERAENR